MLLPISAILERYLTSVENCLVALPLLKRRDITSAGSFAGHQKEADFKILGATDSLVLFWIFHSKPTWLMPRTENIQQA